MKKIIFLLVVLVAIPVMAQTNPTLSDTHKDTDNRTWLNADYKKQFPYPITVGGDVFFNSFYYGFGYVNGIGAVRSGFLYGGGASINARVSFKRWIGLELNMSVSGNSRTENYYDGDINRYTSTFLLSPMVVFQRETLRGQSGWNPFVGIGISLAANTINSVAKPNANYVPQRGDMLQDSETTVGLGLIMSVGGRWNFSNNAYVGPRLDYSISSFQGASVHNINIGVEAGYRF